MDQSKALLKLLEAADLVGMIEELTDPSRGERVSAPAWSGMRISLKQIRETILQSQKILATDFVSRAKLDGKSLSSSSNGQLRTKIELSKESESDQSLPSGMSRQDLKASLGHMLEK